jgi:uncharacterized RDD family membrane protein YckC
MEQGDNPYRPPTSEVKDIAEPREVVPAGRWRRLGTVIIDQILIYALIFVFLVLVAIFFGKRGIEAFQNAPALLKLPFELMFPILYYLIFEGTWARTPGKWVLGTIVVDEAGGKPSLKQALKRTAARFIPFEPFSMLDEKRVGWHDSLATTRVVRYR